MIFLMNKTRDRSEGIFLIKCCYKYSYCWTQKNGLLAYTGSRHNKNNALNGATACFLPHFPLGFHFQSEFTTEINLELLIEHFSKRGVHIVKITETALIGFVGSFYYKTLTFIYDCPRLETIFTVYFTKNWLRVQTIPSK